jgi:hypothetical protein
LIVISCFRRSSSWDFEFRPEQCDLIMSFRLAIIILLVVFFSLNIIRSLAIYEHLFKVLSTLLLVNALFAKFKNYERKNTYQFQLFCSLTLLAVVLLHLLHIFSIGLAILGVRVWNFF